MAEDKFTSGNTSNDSLNTSDESKINNEQQADEAKENRNSLLEEDISEHVQATNQTFETDNSPSLYEEQDTSTEVNAGDIATGDDVQVDSADTIPAKKGNFNIFKLIRILCMVGFIIFTALFINEIIIQPIRIKKSIDLTRELYNKPSPAPIATAAPSELPAADAITKSPEVIEATPTPDPNRDEQGRLLQFKDLLAINEDVKGWLTIPDTNIDYVVMQSSKEEPDYYLDKDINGDYSKAGTLYLDPRSSVEDDTKNLVIHGHNMVSTAEKMFHYLLNYKKVSYYKERPLITFDTIYDPSQWKIFAVFITNGSSKNEPLFDYRKSTFKNDSEFLNFIYQLRIRSVLNIDTVDINENDQILTLSTCSYELDNYRTVIVARKIREGEDPTVDVESVSKNENPLYPESYYYRKGGKAPELAPTFEEALKNGEIQWYLPPTVKTE